MQYEYEMKYLEIGRAADPDIVAWLNARGAIGWRMVAIDAEWKRVIFEREIAINPEIRIRQLREEIESLDKEGKDASGSDQTAETV